MNYNLNAPSHNNVDPVTSVNGLDSNASYWDEASDRSLIGDLIAAVRRRVWTLFIWITICATAGLGYAIVAQPEFVANAQIALEPRIRLPPGTDAAAAAAAATPMLDSSQAESQVQVIRSTRNLRYVFDTLNLEGDPTFAGRGPGIIGRLLHAIFPARELPKPEVTALRARETAFQNFSNAVQVRRLGQSYVLEVSFRGPDPSITARITNSIASAYIRDQVLVHAVSEQRGIEYLQGRISLVQAEKKAADEAVATGVVTDFQFPDSDARIVGSALVPLTASYPQTKLILLFAVLFGLITGTAVIMIWHNFDRTIRSAAQIRHILGLGCFVTVSRVLLGRLKYTEALSQPDTEFGRSIRILRTMIFKPSVPTPYLSIGFVACHSDEGCTTLTANLAFLHGASNSRLVLIDANLQKPDLTRSIMPNASSGLAEFALSAADGEDLPERPLAHSVSFVPAVGAGALGDPNAFLGTRSMQDAIARLSKKKNLIVDLPSLDSSADALAVAPMLSGVVLVISLNRTKIDELLAAVRAFRSVNAALLGVILNDPLPASELRRSMSPVNSDQIRAKPSGAPVSG